MVIKRSDNEEYDEETKAMIEDLLWQRKESEKKLQGIKGKLKNVKSESAERTIQEYNKGFKEKGLNAEVKEDYPRDAFAGMEDLKRFDYRVDPSTIKKTISNITIEPVTVKEKGKLITRHALTVHGKYRGYNHAGVPLLCGLTDGYFYQPNIIYTAKNPNRPYDPVTGKTDGDWKVQKKPEKVYTIYAPEDPKERTKLLEKIISETDTLPGELRGHLMYRQSDGRHGGNLSFEQFCNLTFEQMSQLQKDGYYLDSKQTLRNSEGQMVEYNRSNKLVQAIQ